MKLLIFMALLFTTQPSFADSAYCELSRSGVRDKLFFEHYYEELVEDFDDPACRTPMGRACSKVKIRRAIMPLPKGIYIEHETREALWGKKTKKSSFKVSLMKERDLIEVGGILKQIKLPELRVTVGKIMEGGYTLECRE